MHFKTSFNFHHKIVENIIVIVAGDGGDCGCVMILWL